VFGIATLLTLTACYDDNSPTFGNSYEPKICEGEIEEMMVNVSFGYFHQPEHLISASDYIIHGQSLNSRTEVVEDNFEWRAVITIQQIEVTQVLKGNIEIGDIIEIQQGGGTYGCFRYSVSPSPLIFDENETYLLFLSSWDETIYLTTLYQSVNMIPDGDTSKMEFSFHTGDNTMLYLTYDNLIELIGADE